MLVSKNQLFEKTEENMAGLIGKVAAWRGIIDEIYSKQEELRKNLTELQKECKHEIVIKFKEAPSVRVCFICQFEEIANLSTGFEKLGSSLFVMSGETANLPLNEINDLIRAQIGTGEFLKKYFGE